MIDLKLSKKEKKKLYDGIPVPSGKYDGPDYPYGFEIHIDKEQIKKLGIGSMDAGDMVTLKGIGKIVTKSTTDRTGDDSSKSMTIQIQKIEMKDYNDAEEAFNEK